MNINPISNADEQTLRQIRELIAVAAKHGCGSEDLRAAVESNISKSSIYNGPDGGARVEGVEIVEINKKVSTVTVTVVPLNARAEEKRVEYLQFFEFYRMFETV